MKYAETFLSQELTQALGWTLLHSLWQGALVALALSVVLVFLNRHSAQVRYFVSVTALFTTLALAFFTFFSLYRVPEIVNAENLPASTFSVQNHSVSASIASQQTWYETLPFTSFFSNYFEKHLPLIVTVWFMGLLIMALKMLGGLAYAKRLKHYQANPLNAYWQNKLNELQEKLQFRKPVALLESLQVKVPMVIGFLKPVILIPVGAVNGLTEKQVEAILAHELAHIYRHDYLLNLIQSVVETIFFYHPALWWISANIRAERENCCDDIALNLCGDSIAFAGALAELEERNFTAAPAMGMAFTGKRGSLLGRIKRLLQQPQRSASFSEGFMAACILMVSICAISLSAVAQLTPEFEEYPFYVGSITAEKKASDPEINADLIPAQPEAAPAQPSLPAVAPELGDLEAQGYSLSVSVAPDGDGENIIIVKDRKGNITELYVNGKKVRKKDMPAFQKILDERAGVNKKKKKEFASKNEVKAARETLKNMPDVKIYEKSHPRVYVYGSPEIPEQPQFNSRYRYRYEVPAPPAPFSPIAPVPPMKPMRPFKPIAPIAPMSNPSAEELKEYEEDKKVYEQEMKAYEAEMKAYSENSGKEWQEYGKEMEEYRKEMKEFSKEMAEYGKSISKNVRKQIYIIAPENEEITWDGAGEKNIEIRKHIIRDREVAEKDRAKALEDAAKARESAAKAREVAAKERAKAAEARAKAAEARAKASKERNERMEKIKAELRNDKLIGENDKNLNYQISNEGLTVNGKKQPEATFEKYKKLFHPDLEKGGKYNEVYNLKMD